MKEPDHDRLEEILAELLERQPLEREARLVELCRGDSALESRAGSLLRAHERLGGFLAEPPTIDLVDADAVVRGHGYSIRQKIAVGGMGAVYEAEQDQPRRTVALKVLREGTASSSALKRFRWEAEILGRLQHPNIAQVYEAGMIGEGSASQPFFAMEFIRGCPLLEHAKAQKLGTRSRLALFATICDAVQYAHHKGVIHRDLKPDNILVGDDGEPKILDFGVARATDADLRTTTLQTHMGQLIGTVPYMSPEQISGDPQLLDTRSDVYSLGVVLYELLCGRLPYDIADKSIPDAARIIRDDDPSPLSSVNRVFRGDLDTIVAKAIEKDKDRRYQSAGEIAADLGRFLRDEPITARPAGKLYQLRMFARRNKPLVTGVAAGFFFLVAGMLATTWQAVEARRETARATAIKEFLAAALVAADYEVANRKRSAEEVLDAALAAVPEKLPGELEIEAEVRHVIGLAYASMTAMDKAITQLRKARDLRRDVLGPENEQTLESAQSLAETLHAQGLWGEAAGILRDVVDARGRRLGPDHPDTLWAITTMARSLNVLGEWASAEPLARRALMGLERELGAADPRAIRARYVYGAALWRNGKLDEAENAWRLCHELARDNLGPDHKLTLEMKRELGAFLWELRGDRETGERLIREALDANRRLFGEDDLNTWFWTSTLGDYLAQDGDGDVAGPLLRDGLAGLRRVLGDHNVRTAVAMGMLAEFEDSQGNLKETERLLRRCIQIRRDLLTERHPDTPAAMAYLGWVQHRLSQCAEAQVSLAGALRLQQELHGADHPKILVMRSRLGHCLLDSREYAAAEAHLLAALDGLQDVPGQDGVTLSGGPSAAGEERVLRAGASPGVTSVLEDLVMLYDAWGKPEKAAEYRVLLREAAEWVDEAE